MTSSNKELKTLLVGAHFRPPAKQLLAAVPPGLPLYFEPEWDNPYDSSAIKVKIRIDDVPKEFDDSISEALLGTGWEWHALRGFAPDDEGFIADSIFLGYVAKSGGKPLLKDGRGLPGNQAFKDALGVPEQVWSGRPIGRLSFGPNGEPQVILSLELLANVKANAER